MYKNIRFGLCCLLVGESRSKFRTLQLNRTLEDPNKFPKILEVWDHNLKELCKVLDYCISNKIWHYRISSDMFPLADVNGELLSIWLEYLSKPYNWVVAKNKVKEFLSLGGRLSTHPSQFCVITSEKETVRTNSIKNLEYHAQFFDVLGIPDSYFCPINIHLSNGKLGSKGADYARESLNILSDSVKKRLVFETEDKNYWTWQKINQYFPEIPITLDFHHRLINNEGETEEEAYGVCVKSWGDIKPLFHHSEGRDHKLDRSHHDFVDKIPDLCEDVDVEIEAKQKNLAILKLQNKYAI